MNISKLIATIFTEACKIREESYDKEGADKASAAAQKERETDQGNIYVGFVDYSSFYRKTHEEAAVEAATKHGQPEMDQVIYYLMYFAWNDMQNWAKNQEDLPAKGGLPQHLMDATETAWESRASVQNYPKPTTKTYKDKEGEFFIGAMVAFDAVGYVMPPKWVLNIMQNKNASAK